MKRNFFKIFTAAAILAVFVTGCSPSKKDIAEKKLLEEKIADLESKLQKVSIIENSKIAIEEFVKKDAPPGGTVKCLSVVLNDPCGQNEWLAESDIFYTAPGIQPEIEGLTGIRVVYNPENKSVEADLSKAKPKKDSRRVEVSCTSNLKMLGVALRQYASDFGDKYPSVRDLNALIKNNKINKSIIRCPGSEQPYVYVPGLRYGGPAKLTLAHCKFHKKNGEFLQVHADGSAGYGKILLQKHLDQ